MIIIMIDSFSRRGIAISLDTIIDENSDTVPPIELSWTEGIRESIQTLAKESPDLVMKYIMMLQSGLDQCIARMYWVERLTQDQISLLIHMTQVAIWKRLNSILRKLRFIIQAANIDDPIQVKSDLESLLEGEDGENIEIAYLQFFEGSLSRTATILGISPTRASNGIKRILQRLEEKVSRGDAVAGLML
jgi:DNA-directed RNA polymerase specialized sigma subunit